MSFLFRVQMPVLDTAELEADPRLLRRAHHVLAFLVHFYVHSTPPASTPVSSAAKKNDILIPRSLAIPLVKVSRILNIAPVLTFADSVLWNFEVIDDTKPLERNNIRPLSLFTGGADEANFYGCCAEIELRGVEALRAIAQCYDAVAACERVDVDSNNTPLDDTHARQHSTSTNNASSSSSSHSRSSAAMTPAQLDTIACCLKDVALVIDDLTTILQSVRAMCDPHAFYFAVRPWFRGSDAGGPESAQWIFEGIEELGFADGEGSSLELSGPSAGQSSIIHTLDAWLEVDHASSYSVPSSSASASEKEAAAGCPMMKGVSKKDSKPKSKPAATTINGHFMDRMRKYMPGSHQDFLADLSNSSTTTVRDLATLHPAILLAPYNEAVLALKKFRDLHIRIACLYIVTMSRKAGVVDVGYVGMGGTGGMPAACPMSQEARKPVRGTGGNELSSLLKSCRDATTRTLLPTPAVVS